MEYGQDFYQRIIRHTSLSLLLAATMLLFACGRHQQQEAVQYDAARLVSLAPSVTETLFALGLGENVVGVSSFCKYPPQVQQLPAVGGFIDTDFEAIARLKPTCVVLTASNADTAERLRSMSIPVLEVPLRSFSDIPDSFELIGTRLGHSEEGRNLKTRFLSQLQREQRMERRALLVISRDYGSGRIGEVQVAGSSSIYSGIAEACNVTLLPPSSMQYPVLSPENILRLNPDVIYELNPDCKDAAAAQKAWLNSFPQLKAVQSNAVHIITDDFAVIPGPRFAELDL